MRSDTDLLDAWADGDETAGAVLFERHYSAVYRFFRAKGVGDLEDLVQETFLAVLRNRDAFRREAPFRSYMFGTARNILRHHFRRQRRREDKIDFGSKSVADLAASPSAVVAEKAEHRLLLEGLRRLAIDDQIVIELFEWENMTALEVGAVLELTEPAVRSRLHRARHRLRALLEDLATSPAVLKSTLSDLDAWAGEVRELRPQS